MSRIEMELRIVDAFSNASEEDKQQLLNELIQSTDTDSLAAILDRHAN